MPPDLADELLIEVPPEAQLPPLQAAQGRKRPGRLPHLPGPFVRIPIEWLKPYSPRKSPFDPPTRLYLFVLYKSYWGQKGVKLTSALAAEIGMSRRTKN